MKTITTCKKHETNLKFDISSNSYYCKECLEEDIILEEEENDYFLLANEIDEIEY